MAPRTQPPDPADVELQICGRAEIVTLDTKRHQTDLDAEVLKAFRYRVGEHVPLWHNPGEECYIRRPLDDLLLLATNDPGTVTGEPVKLHMHRLRRPAQAGVGRPRPSRRVSGSGGGAGGGEPSAGGGRSGDDGGAGGGKGRGGDGGAEHRGGARGHHGAGRDNGEDDAAGNRVPADDGHPSDSDGSPTDDESVARGAAGPSDVTILRLFGSDDTLQQLGLENHTGPLIRVQGDRASEVPRTEVRQAVIEMLGRVTGIDHRLAGISAVFFDLALNIPAHGDDRPVDMDDRLYGARLPAISDLFLDPHDPIPAVEGIITLHLKRSPPQKKRKMRKELRPSDDLDRLIQEVIDDDGHHFVRVGVTKAPNPGANDADEDNDNFPTQFPIVAEVDRARERLVSVWGTKAWDFDDQCIGGFYLRKEPINVVKTHGWFKGYRGTNDKAELETRIFKPVATDPRLPFMPPMTFNRFDRKAYTPRLGTARFTENLRLLVLLNFVSHVDDDAGEWSHFIGLDQVFPASDTMTSAIVRAETLADLAKTEGTESLFREPLKGRWRMDLWAMPHEPAPQKLFRFGYADDDQTLLKHFVSRRAVDGGYLKLYMEAHIWPVDKPESEQSDGKSGIKDKAMSKSEGKKREAPDKPSKSSGPSAGAARRPSAQGKKSSASGKSAKHPIELDDDDYQEHPDAKDLPVAPKAKKGARSAGPRTSISRQGHHEAPDKDGDECPGDLSITVKHRRPAKGKGKAEPGKLRDSPAASDARVKAEYASRSGRSLPQKGKRSGPLATSSQRSGGVKGGHAREVSDLKGHASEMDGGAGEGIEEQRRRGIEALERKENERVLQLGIEESEQPTGETKSKGEVMAPLTGDDFLEEEEEERMTPMRKSRRATGMKTRTVPESLQEYRREHGWVDEDD
ncbi:hypothetical protein LTR53_000539 [Teratosphaeriaceae sp. CCFEE 6253]|nr:hypothetical protein LTR53_000539 [Teratosphaeriaceae sp. CCFEE 6253]